MADISDKTPLGWLEILEESEAELEAGLILSREIVHRELQESLVRLEAGKSTPQRKATSYR